MNSVVVLNSQIRCCSSNVARLTNLLKVMKKETGRAEDLVAMGSLNLFKNTDTPQRQRVNRERKLWSELEEEELKLFEQKPVKNGFEEMINWTNEGIYLLTSLIVKVHWFSD